MRQPPDSAPARDPQRSREPSRSPGSDGRIITDAAYRPKRSAASGLLTLSGVAHELGVGRSTVDDWDRSELLPAPTVIRGRRYWSTVGLRAWGAWGSPRRAAWSRMWPRIRRELLAAQASPDPAGTCEGGAA